MKQVLLMTVCLVMGVGIELVWPLPNYIVGGLLSGYLYIYSVFILKGLENK